LGSNNFKVDICSNYFDFDKKEQVQNSNKKGFPTVEKIRKVRKDSLKNENKKEDENKIYLKSILHSSSFSSKISCSLSN